MSGGSSVIQDGREPRLVPTKRRPENKTRAFTVVCRTDQLTTKVTISRLVWS